MRKLILGDDFMGNNHKRNEDTYEIIAGNIKEIRKKAKMTQAELADKAHYSHEFIRRIEAPNSKKYFSLDTLVQISRALDVGLEELIRDVK